MRPKVFFSSPENENEIFEKLAIETKFTKIDIIDFYCLSNIGLYKYTDLIRNMAKNGVNDLHQVCILYQMGLINI